MDIDEATRRQRWLDRNRQENRGTTDNMWNTTVDCLNQFILPTRPVADLVINNIAPQAQVVQFLLDVVDSLAGLRELEVPDSAEQSNLIALPHADAVYDMWDRSGLQFG